MFFVALDDGLMRKMGGEKIQALAGMLLSRSDLANLLSLLPDLKKKLKDGILE